MDQEIIHINIGGSVTEEGIVATYSVRVWSHLMLYINEVIKGPIASGLHYQHGLSMTIISNSAIAMEGFIGDLIYEYIDDKPHLKSWTDSDFNKKGWGWKKDQVYNKLFTKSLESYTFYEEIDNLMKFRNNLAHGKTYNESTFKEVSGLSPSNLSADNWKYNDVREFLIKRGLLKNSNISSTSEVPWKLGVSVYFFGVVKEFMKELLKENESDKKIGIEGEFNLLVTGK